MKLGITIIALFSGVLIASVVLVVLCQYWPSTDILTLTGLTFDVAGVLCGVKLVRDSRKGAKNGKY